MNKFWFFIVSGFFLVGIIMWHNRQISAVSYDYRERACSGKSLDLLFPSSAESVNILKNQYKKQIQHGIDSILSIPAEKRTFANTFYAIDQLSSISDAAVFGHLCGVLEMVSIDTVLRDAAHQAQKELQSLWIDLFSNNKPLYDACKNFYQFHQSDASFSEEQRYYMQELIADFERAGLNKSDQEREQIVALKKELVDFALLFDKQIAEDNRTIMVQQADLVGLDDQFIVALKKTDAGAYILGVDYPTYFNVMEHCAVEQTRKKLYEAFSQRGYPANVSVLGDIIQKRDQLAKLLGYSSYTAYDLADQMAQNPARIDQFLHELVQRSRIKEQAELAELIRKLPASVTLTDDGKIKPWDLSYLKSIYKKNHYALDERELANYFPVDQTISRLLDIYRAFFSLDFVMVPTKVWHEDVQLIKVLTADHTQVLGYLFLDLFPRSNKYNHACHATIVPGMIHEQGARTPTVSAVLANFPKATAEKPALLMRKDVETFFHEFGHALHAVLGATQMASFSGTSVKRDFVEMPSQMLEEWLWDKEILKQVSGHYQTGKPLPDELIDTILQLKQFDSGMFVQTQILYARISLDYFNQGADIDPYSALRDLYAQYRPQLLFHPDNHMYASFGHLTGYGAKYYGYLWSKVFALDLFETIKKEGLLNPKVGARYVAAVIGKGGSKDPNELLNDFLGREPQQDAFLRDLGLT